MIQMKRYLLFLSFFVMSAIACSSETSSEKHSSTDETAEQLVRMPQPVKIVCIGNSITEGFGNTSQAKAWPGQLGVLLGQDYSVLNCGVSGTTMFKNSESPYWKTDRFVKAKEANPQILIIALGTNDADPWRWNKLKSEFKADYLDMVAQFREQGKDPIIYVCLAPPLFGEVKKPQNTVVENELIPLVKEIAQEIDAQVIDFHTPLLNAHSGFPDDVHPDDSGATLMAKIAEKKIKSIQTLRPEVSVTHGEVIQESIALVEKGSSVTLEPTPEDGFWTWSGPMGFSENKRVITLGNISQGGVYTAIRTSNTGERSIINFLISIKGESGSPITPRVKGMDGIWHDSSFMRVNPGGNLTLGPTVKGEAGTWTWQGSDGFFAATREITLNTILPSQAGEYTVTHTDNQGRQSSAVFTIAVEGEVVCPDLVPYVNYNGWENVSEMEVKEGDSVTFGPHPSNGDWHWEGPAGFISDRREATVSNFNIQKAGRYIGTFTNSAGCHEELVIVLKLKK